MVRARSSTSGPVRQSAKATARSPSLAVAQRRAPDDGAYRRRVARPQRLTTPERNSPSGKRPRVGATDVGRQRLAPPRTDTTGAVTRSIPSTATVSEEANERTSPAVSAGARGVERRLVLMPHRPSHPARADAPQRSSRRVPAARPPGPVRLHRGADLLLLHPGDSPVRARHGRQLHPGHRLPRAGARHRIRTRWLNQAFLRVYRVLGWHNFHEYAMSHTHHHRYTLHPTADEYRQHKRPFSLAHRVSPGHQTTADFPSARCRSESERGLSSETAVASVLS